MRNALTLAAAAVINLTALAALEWNVTQAQLPPAGEVTITQIQESSEVAAFARISADGHVARTASNSR